MHRERKIYFKNGREVKRLKECALAFSVWITKCFIIFLYLLPIVPNDLDGVISQNGEPLAY